jgi:hypothetical protein
VQFLKMSTAISVPRYLLGLSDLLDIDLQKSDDQSTKSVARTLNA